MAWHGPGQEDPGPLSRPAPRVGGYGHHAIGHHRGVVWLAGRPPRLPVTAITRRRPEGPERREGRIEGRNGSDIIDAGAGDDVVGGGDGNDQLTAGPGNDFVDGGTGRDTIDTVDGVAGNDYARGGPPDGHLPSRSHRPRHGMPLILTLGAPAPVGPGAPRSQGAAARRIRTHDMYTAADSLADKLVRHRAKFKGRWAMGAWPGLATLCQGRHLPERPRRSRARRAGRAGSGAVSDLTDVPPPRPVRQSSSWSNKATSSCPQKSASMLTFADFEGLATL
ncbi:calcium-binding protein [Streptomyces erythrochromogenes]|uniref:calcium-binding protein n=1 Tax=Streptomyces erythrochromogenes TaxID=285574 RepID=UPI0036C37074